MKIDYLNLFARLQRLCEAFAGRYLVSWLLIIPALGAGRRGTIRARTNNLFILFFIWWYGPGFLRLMKYLKAVTIYITDMFSVKMIFETLFLPWKRDQGGTKGLALNEKLMVWLLNLTSRLVGFIVKSIVFFVYLLFICGFFAVSVILIVSWFLMPIIIFGLFIAGVFQILSSIHG